jgi:hypothetical protein
MSSVVGNIGAGLAADAKNWALPRFWKWFARQLTRTTAREFSSIQELAAAIDSRSIGTGDWVKLRCKPMAFGPMLASFFMPPITGFRTGLRLGPTISTSPHPALARFDDATAHWLPAGLYPPLGDGVTQACLYPFDAAVTGVLGPLHEIRKVPTIPALVPNRFADTFNLPGWITAQVRRVDVDAFISAGYSAEDYEGYRQGGGGWFLDATHDDAQFLVMSGATMTEMWGALYAAGHFELRTSGLQVRELIDAFAAAIGTVAEPPHITQNKAGRKEIMFFARGIRASLLPNRPIYAIHMDAELALGFAESRQRFETVIGNLLKGVEDLCRSKSIELANPGDLDFTYLNSVESYDVLRSRAAERITDPVLVSIRDWHRLRNRA